VRVGVWVITDGIYRPESQVLSSFQHFIHFHWLTDLLNRCHVVAAALSH
jgi:hypothetical protein